MSDACTAIEVGCVQHAEDDVQPGAIGRIDDRVELTPVVLTGRLFDLLPFDLMLGPVEPSLLDVTDGESLSLLAYVPHVYLEAIRKRSRGRRRSATRG